MEYLMCVFVVINVNDRDKIINANLFFFFLRWITCTIGSESLCVVGTTEYLVGKQVAVRAVHWFSLEPE